MGASALSAPFVLSPMNYIICHQEMSVTGTLSAAALTNGRNAVAIIEDESSRDNVFGRLMDLAK